MGWTPEVTLSTPIPQIERALKGKIAYLRAANGLPDPDAEQPPDIQGKPEDLITLLRRRARG